MMSMPDVLLRPLIVSLVFAALAAPVLAGLASRPASAELDRDTVITLADID